MTGRKAILSLSLSLSLSLCLSVSLSHLLVGETGPEQSDGREMRGDEEVAGEGVNSVAKVALTKDFFDFASFLMK